MDWAIPDVSDKIKKRKMRFQYQAKQEYTKATRQSAKRLEFNTPKAGAIQSLIRSQTLKSLNGWEAETKSGEVDINQV